MPTTEAHGDAPPYWLPYFTVVSCDGAIAKVGELAGGVLAGPMDLEAGRIAALTDPQGAVFAVFEGETENQPDGARYVTFPSAPRLRMRYTGDAGNIRKEG